ncbi:MAG: DNA polymerase III subunit delta [Dehalococcoidia bacterium]|jgi:DNA polymerase-3 subunit delta
MFYIIYGDDNYRCHETLTGIKAQAGGGDLNEINTTVLNGKKLSTRELSETCDAVPFMSANRLVIVEGLLKRFQAGEKQARSNGNGDENGGALKEWQVMADYIKRMPETTMLVLFETDMDPKSSNPLLKALSPLADKVFQLNELKGKELTAWIRDCTAKNKGKISAAAVSLLADYIGGDLWLLAGELNKLITYCGDREISDKDVREITSFAREDNIFALVDSIMDGRTKEAQIMLHRMLSYGTASQQILVMIERQLSIILRVKDLGPNMNQQEMKERLGLHPRYPLEKTLRQAKAFPLPRLRKAFHCLLDTDIAIKTGKYEDDLALDLMILELCKS